MSPSEILFTVEEAFARVGSTKGTGCLLVFNPRESVHIFIEAGVVVCAKWNDLVGEEALKHGLALKEAAYRWIPDATPSKHSVKINIDDYLAQNVSRDERAGKTIKMAVYERTEKSRSSITTLSRRKRRPRACASRRPQP